MELADSANLLASHFALDIMIGNRYSFLLKGGSKMSIAADLREEVRTAPIGTWFSVSDLTERYGHRSAVDVALSRAAKAGDLVRVRRGVYWKGTKTRFGVTKPDTFSIGIGVLKAAGITSGVGPTGWSASQALGLSTQIPSETHIAVPGRPPAAATGVRYYTRSSRWRADLELLEVALLEILRDFPYRVEVDWESLAECAVKLHEDGAIDLMKIAAVSEKEKHLAARGRARELATKVEQVALLNA